MDNDFITVINYLKDTLQADPDINIVTHGVSNDIDMDKKTNYPLAHIQFLSFNNQYATGVVSFLFEVHLLIVRDINKNTSTDKWLRNDNEFSNYNRTIKMNNRLMYHFSNYNNLDIEMINATAPEAVSLEFLNMLDGCKFQIELSITNNYNPCP